MAPAGRDRLPHGAAAPPRPHTPGAAPAPFAVITGTGTGYATAGAGRAAGRAQLGRKPGGPSLGTPSLPRPRSGRTKTSEAASRTWRKPAGRGGGSALSPRPGPPPARGVRAAELLFTIKTSPVTWDYEDGCCVAEQDLILQTDDTNRELARTMPASCATPSTSAGSLCLSRPRLSSKAAAPPDHGLQRVWRLPW
ncbi:collagen alpha-1(I) chain-like [Manacus candei]|uniref:collagen alpha-1(I) chain-like n=1 Tax=Manacus candei TaxID=415023 RepID=UPI002226F1F2|nr:collagen alpha-1(I) chain-like [Manacus candei]